MQKADKIGWVVLIAAVLVEVIWLLWPKTSGEASAGSSPMQLGPSAIAERNSVDSVAAPEAAEEAPRLPVVAPQVAGIFHPVTITVE